VFGGCKVDRVGWRQPLSFPQPHRADESSCAFSNTTVELDQRHRRWGQPQRLDRVKNPFVGLSLILFRLAEGDLDDGERRSKNLDLSSLALVEKLV
jgi:hypothetical protein